jgi:hypothetical protein
MKLFIGFGGAEIFMVLFIILLYAGLFMLAVYIMRSIFKINKFTKYQVAQTKLLAEIAKKQGVDENVIRGIESTLE